MVFDVNISCSLVVQLSRDLRKDFYKHFPKFFDVVIEVLNSNSQSWEVLEQGFTCLSYMIKLVWRQAIKDMKQVCWLNSSFFPPPLFSSLPLSSSFPLSHPITHLSPLSRSPLSITLPSPYLPPSLPLALSLFPSLSLLYPFSITFLYFSPSPPLPPI